MKNIVAITLTVLALLLVGFLVVTFSENKATNDITSYLPNSFNTTRALTLFQKDAPPEQHTIYLGAKEGEESAFTVVSGIGHYINESNKLALTLWVENIIDDKYELYKQKAWERYQAPERGGSSEKITITEHEVYLSFRNIDETTDDTSKMITMGGGYVFIPENKIVVAYTVYNPRLFGCEDLQKPETCMFDKNMALPTKEDNKKIAEQILSNIQL